MKRILFIVLIAIIAVSCTHNEKKVDIKQGKQGSDSVSAYDSLGKTNDSFDNDPAKQLKLNDLYVCGEVEDSGIVDLSKLQIRSKLVKETLLKDGDTVFIGAYRYDGYSLHDILNLYLLKKKNSSVFKPIVDAYVEVENDKGEKAVFSWGEIFYPNDRHEILIAQSVMRIVPVKSKDMWPLPDQSKLVVANDLLTHRNISNPVKITVKSFDIQLPVKKGLKPLYSDNVNLHVEDKIVDNIKSLPPLNEEKVNTIFYGRGRGIHSTDVQKGIYLKNYLKQFISIKESDLQHSLVIVAAADGYRAVFSLSEICNRNDQSEVLFKCDHRLTDNGVFRIMPLCDFFSDRAVKGISDIYYFSNY